MYIYGRKKLVLQREDVDLRHDNRAVIFFMGGYDKKTKHGYVSIRALCYMNVVYIGMGYGLFKCNAVWLLRSLDLGHLLL